MPDKAPQDSKQPLVTALTPVANTPAAQMPGTLVVETSPPPAHDGWKDYSEAVGATSGLLWTFLVLLIAYAFKAQLRGLLAALAGRIADPNSVVKLGPLELQRIEVLESKVTSQTESNQVDRQVLTAARQGLEHTDADSIQRLHELSQRYQHVDVQDLAERVRCKDELAAEMASLIIDRKLSRAELASMQDEGVRVALATAINTLPQEDDARWIQIAAPGAHLRHVRYRFMIAIARLAQLGWVNAAQARDFHDLAERYRQDADEPLQRRITRTLVILRDLVRSIR